MTAPEGRRRRWPYLVPLFVITVALVITVFLPFVNSPTLWFGLPSVGVWTVLWVLAITAALAAVEFGYRRPGDDADDDGDELNEGGPQ